MYFCNMKKYYRYIEPSGFDTKYVEACHEVEALEKLSYLVDDGYASTETVRNALKLFEEIEYFELPDNVTVLTESYKNKDGFQSATPTGWTQLGSKPHLNLYYVMPYKVFVIANSEEAVRTKIFPIEALINRLFRKEKELHPDKFPYESEGLFNTWLRIFPFLTYEWTWTGDFKQHIPEGCRIIREPTLEYDRWGNYIKGYLFNRNGHQEWIGESRFESIIKSGLLFSFDQLAEYLPPLTDISYYGRTNKELLSSQYNYDSCKEAPLAHFLSVRNSDMDFIYQNGKMMGRLSATGETLEIEDEIINDVLSNGLSNRDDYEVCRKKSGWNICRCIRRIKTWDFDDDLP